MPNDCSVNRPTTSEAPLVGENGEASEQVSRYAIYYARRRYDGPRPAVRR